MGIIFWPCSHSLFPRLGVSSLSDLFYAKQHFWTMFWYGIDSEHYHRGSLKYFSFPSAHVGPPWLLPTAVIGWSALVRFSLSGLIWDCSLSGKMEVAATAISPQVMLFLLDVTPIWILSFCSCGTFIQRVLVETPIEIIEYCLSRRIAMSGTGRTVVTVNHCSNI